MTNINQLSNGITVINGGIAIFTKFILWNLGKSRLGR